MPAEALAKAGLFIFAKASADSSAGGLGKAVPAEALAKAGLFILAKASADSSAGGLGKAVPAEASAKAGLSTHSSAGNMKIVYLIRSTRSPGQTYIGVTSDLGRRLKEHNAGRSPHTAKHAPWELVVAVHFSNKRKANEFERYLKTGSGRAFAQRRFW